MKPTDAYGDLLRLGQPIVETAEAAARLGLSVSRTSHLLRSLAEAGLTRRIHHGLWSLTVDIEPFRVAPYLTAPFPAYVSFWSALAHHGLIEQIPRQVYVASTDRKRTVATTIGTFSIHHIVPELFDGYTGSEATGYMATPEKALFDTVYIRSPRGMRLHLPEIALPEGFDPEQFAHWTSRIASARLRTLVERGLEAAVSKAFIEE